LNFCSYHGKIEACRYYGILKSNLGQKGQKMIAFIKGTVEYILNSSLIINNNDMGYEVYANQKTLLQVKESQEVKLFTHMSVREDNMSLFGFLTKEELDSFNLLIGVSGVGPKVAVTMLNSLTHEELVTAIATEDIEKLSKCPGIGKKTSQRIILDLKDKVKSAGGATYRQQAIKITSNEKADAIEALVALGYNRNDSMKAVMEIANLDMTTEQIIKSALKKLAERF